MDLHLAKSEPPRDHVDYAGRMVIEAVKLFMQHKTSGSEVIRTAQRLVEVMDEHKVGSAEQPHG